MKNIFNIIAWGIVVLLFFDTAGSLMSNKMQFSYTSLWMGSVIIYGVVGYFSVKKSNNIKYGALAAAVLGLFDTTIGWKISIWLNAYSPDREIESASTATWITTIIIGTLFATLIGFLGGALNKLKKK